MPRLNKFELAHHTENSMAIKLNMEPEGHTHPSSDHFMSLSLPSLHVRLRIPLKPFHVLSQVLNRIGLLHEAQLIIFPHMLGIISSFSQILSSLAALQTFISHSFKMPLQRHLFL